MKQNKVIQLSEITHVLKRSARYLGSTTLSKLQRYYFKDNQIVFGEIEYVPALLKIIRELIDNSIDEGIRTGFKFANKIDITISKNTVTILDNGRGIPVIYAEDEFGNELKELMPTMAWCSLRSGSNFDDLEDDETAGQNGEGASLCNAWSKEFIGETCDGQTYYKIICKDNLSSKDISTKQSTKRFTKVSFSPDLERMGISEISDIYMDLIEFDLLFLQETFKEIKFTMKRV